MPLEGIIGLATALIGLATAVIVLIVKVQRVHVLVNDRMSEAMARVDQLTAALTAAGVGVPGKHEKEKHAE